MMPSRLLLLVILACLTACTAKPETAILGKWQGIEPTDGTLEFRSDGTVSLSTDLYPVPVELQGNYSLLPDNQQLILNLNSEGTQPEPLVMNMEIADDDLILTFPNQAIAYYRRL